MLRLLGPAEPSAASGALSTPRQRLVLAVLAVEAGRPVPMEVLVDRVWGANPPPQVRRTVHAYIARGRRALAELPVSTQAPIRIDRRGGGYVLDLDADQVDLHRFRRLVGQAHAPDCPPPQRVALLREACGLWDGQPLTGLDGEWVERTRASWQLERLAAAVDWGEAELAAGDPSAVLGPLGELASEHPFAESLAATLVRVLGATGRTPDALGHFQATRRRLADELGVNPGPELQAAHLAVLRHEVGRPARSAVPAQLPMGLAVFAGRTEQLAALDDLATRTAGTVVAVICGTAGVGKTTLAVHWAHRAAHRFPDGQLFVDLRGFDAEGQPVDPGTVIRTVLEALAVPADQVPADPDAQVSLYRGTMRGRRMLIVLDNARTAAQVRPLLPGAAHCMVLVTSRNRLTGLLARDGGHAVAVDLLTLEEARDLLRRRLGRNRLAAEPDAVREIIECCARLPLALAIVSAHAATHPAMPVVDLAGALRDSRARLDALTGPDDPATDVRAAFSCSYRSLDASEARLFRLLGLHPTAELSLTAAASLAGLPPASVRPLLTRLATASLVTQPSAGRYLLHDLLHAYSADLSRQVDNERVRRAAIRRVLDHYLHTCLRANRLLYPSLAAAPGPPRRGVTVEAIDDDKQAMHWFSVEQGILLAVVRSATANGFDAHAAGLAGTVADYLDRGGRWHDLAEVQRMAVAVTDRLGDQRGQVDSRRLLARADLRLGRFDEARAYLMEALDLCTAAGDRSGQAKIHHNLAMTWERQGEYAQALHHAGQALVLYRSCGDVRGQALALNGVGWCESQLGSHERALASCQEALDLLSRLGDRPGQADAWDSVGHAHQHLGDHASAITDYRHALDLYRELGHQYREADTLVHLGDCHQAGGDPDTARESWQQALAILTALGHADADRIRARLV